MNPWQKESLNLKVGDWIIWRDQPRQLIIHKDGTKTTYLTPGMKGQVVELHDGCPPSKLEAKDDSVLPWAFVEGENGETAIVELGMKWEIADPGYSPDCPKKTKFSSRFSAL